MFAQGPGPGGPGHGPGGTPPDPQAAIEMRVNFLTAALSLTDAQKAQATTIFTDAFNAGQTAHTNLQTARQSLAAAVKKNDTAAIDQIAAAIGTLDAQLTAINAKADAAFYAILTPDQQAKYDSMPHGGPGGPGPMGGFRGAAGFGNRR